MLLAIRTPVEVLQDAEVNALFIGTNSFSWYESQRMNLLNLAFQLRQRPETLVRLLIGNFIVGDDEGTIFLEVTISTMKNLQGNQKTVSRPLHHQNILKHPNPNLCGIAAYHRQIALLGPDPSNESFFPGARLFTKEPQSPPLMQLAEE